MKSIILVLIFITLSFSKTNKRIYSNHNFSEDKLQQVDSIYKRQYEISLELLWATEALVGGTNTNKEYFISYIDFQNKTKLGPNGENLIENTKSNYYIALRILTNERIINNINIIISKENVFGSLPFSLYSSQVARNPELIYLSAEILRKDIVKTFQGLSIETINVLDASCVGYLGKFGIFIY